jgi:hypothetical protein
VRTEPCRATDGYSIEEMSGHRTAKLAKSGLGSVRHTGHKWATSACSMMGTRDVYQETTGGIRVKETRIDEESLRRESRVAAETMG